MELESDLVSVAPLTSYVNPLTTVSTPPKITYSKALAELYLRVAEAEQRKQIRISGNALPSRDPYGFD